jgi:HEPN domain-containing protein
VSEEDAKARMVCYWWDKAQESLKAARRELAADAYAFAINRAYYALFYAVSALLRKDAGSKGTAACEQPSTMKSSEPVAWIEGSEIRTMNCSMIDKRVITSPSRSLRRHMSKRQLRRAKYIFGLS